MTYPTLTTVPKELYYHEVAYVRGLEEDKADLLAALKRYVAARNVVTHEDQSMLDQARAAVAKAEGR